MKTDETKQASDADDFYVFLYDEEDKSMLSFKKSRYSKAYESNRFQRVLGFWCFNAGIGFRHI